MSGKVEGPALDLLKLRYQAERLEHVYGMNGAAENIREAATNLENALADAQSVAAGGEVDDGMFYIQDSRSYVGNCPLWWAPQGNGYVTRLDQAGRYTLADAMEQHRSRDTDVPWPCAEIDALVRGTVDVQDMRPVSRQVADLATQHGDNT